MDLRAGGDRSLKAVLVVMSQSARTALKGAPGLCVSFYTSVAFAGAVRDFNQRAIPSVCHSGQYLRASVSWGRRGGSRSFRPAEPCRQSVVRTHSQSKKPSFFCSLARNGGGTSKGVASPGHLNGPLIPILPSSIAASGTLCQPNREKRFMQSPLMATLRYSGCGESRHHASGDQSACR